MMNSAALAVLTLPVMITYINQVMIPVGGSAMFMGMSGMGKTQANAQNIREQQEFDPDFGGCLCNWANMESIDARGLPRVGDSADPTSRYGIPPWLLPVPELGLRGAFPALCPIELRGNPKTWSPALRLAYETSVEEQLKTYGRLLTYSRGIVVIDECLQTLEDSMLLVLAQLFDEHRIGEHGVPLEGWAIIGLTNRMADQAGVRELHAHTRNRLAIFEVEHDIEATLKYWSDTGMNAGFRYFAAADPETVFSKRVPDGQQQFCTPRSWTRAHADCLMWCVNVDHVDPSEVDLTDYQIPYDHKMLPILIAARCGAGTALKFGEYLRNSELRPTYEEIVKAPAKARLPGNSAVIRSVIEMLLDYAKIPDLEKIATYMQRDEMPVQIVSIFCQQLVRRRRIPVDVLYQHDAFLRMLDHAGPSAKQLVFACEYATDR
jgi:hypothetical protein